MQQTDVVTSARTTKQPSVADRAEALERITGNYLTLRAESLSAVGRSGRLAELAIHPQLADQLVTGKPPSWARAGDGRLLYSNAVASNILLGLIESSLRQDVVADKNHPAHLLSTRDRLFDLRDFAEALDGSLTINSAVLSAFTKLPAAKKHAEYYRSILAHGDRPTTPLSTRDWDVVVQDSLTAARDIRNFVDATLPAIVARHGKAIPEIWGAKNIGGALRAVVGYLSNDRARGIVECARIECDADMMAQLRYWSAADQSLHEQGGSSQGESVELLRKAAKKMDQLKLERNRSVEKMAGL